MDKNQENKQNTDSGTGKEDIVKKAVEDAKKAAEKESKDHASECDFSKNTDADQEESESAKAQNDGGEVPTESENASEDDENEVEEQQEKSKLFGRKNKKDKKDEKIEELTDRLTRQIAEFDNFRKRTDREKSQMYEIGAKDIIEKILPVVDNFERGLESVGEEEKKDPFVQGMDKVYKHLMTTLEEAGVKPIEAVGNEFNPDLHNAVMHVEDENFGENIVAEEFQKGYMYRESVVRHSMVKVAN